MKKIVTALLLCAVMVMAFAACGGDTTSEVASSESTATESTSVVTSEAASSEATSAPASEAAPSEATSEATSEVADTAASEAEVVSSTAAA
ncbi:hypothetical protein LJC49_03230 [Ruminococcaceae bacterium OttesenSCG-928-I18]|nr:hypothetical protein [Ruminococcaceae bacterium OttesenSCG-928-I18]